MNNNILRACIFWCILCLGIALIVYPGNAFFIYKKEYQRAIFGVKAKDIHVLLLGDSHAAILSQNLFGALTYNLASTADTPREMYLKIVYVLKESHGLQYLLLQADPHILCKYRFTTENKSFIRGSVPKAEFYAVYGINEQQSLIQDVIDDCPFLSGDLYVLARKKILLTITHLFFKEKDRLENYADKSFQQKQRDAAHRAEDHFSAGEDKDTLFYYQKIMMLCQERGIHVIGIRYPVSREYLQAAQKLHWSDLATQINQLGFERVLDYARFFPDPGYFQNTDHIQSKSAKILLEQMRKDLPAANI